MGEGVGACFEVSSCFSRCSRCSLSYCHGCSCQSDFLEFTAVGGRCGGRFGIVYS
jgi:hypothetical protein